MQLISESTIAEMIYGVTYKTEQNQQLAQNSTTVNYLFIHTTIFNRPRNFMVASSTPTEIIILAHYSNQTSGQDVFMQLLRIKPYRYNHSRNDNIIIIKARENQQYAHNSILSIHEFKQG
jgi:hypothetical protein